MLCCGVHEPETHAMGRPWAGTAHAWDIGGGGGGGGGEGRGERGGGGWVEARGRKGREAEE